MTYVAVRPNEAPGEAPGYYFVLQAGSLRDLQRKLADYGLALDPTIELGTTAHSLRSSFLPAEHFQPITDDELEATDRVDALGLAPEPMW